MLNEITYPESGEYRTGTENEPLNFFADVLPESTQFDILLGYFSSSAIRVLSLGFAKFILQGGRARFIINHIVSEHDKEAILKGEKTPESELGFSINSYRQIKESLDSEGVHFFNCLAWLIASKRVEIVAVRPKGTYGIAHQKTGIFSDGQNEVLFDGSCNFTAMALLGNIEKLSTRFSWENSARDKAAIAEQKKYFDLIFSKKADFLDYLDINDLEIAIKTDFGIKDLDELLIDETTLLAKRKKILNTNPQFRKRLENLEKELNLLRSTPRFPYEEGARQYQKDAYSKWLDNDCKGIFAMATGTGKTITALNCVLEEYKKENFYKVIITVPTTALLEQWKKECAKFNFKNIITVSSKENWEGNLSFFNTASKLIDTSYIVIVTYASLWRDKFQSFFKQLPKETFLIADETHNLGSQSLLKVLPTIHLERRIGLSATPFRKFDESGNNAIGEFFNDKSPYIVSFSMQQALEKGFLCQYTYFPHVVKLTDEEMKRYKEISLQLLRMGLFDKNGNFKSSPEIERKLLERKRIIHKATNKIDAFQRILKDEFNKRKNLKYTLIYVPEGNESNFDTKDFSVETEEENKLINEYTKVVSNTNDSVMVKQFTSNSKNREEILVNYEKGITHVLTSMKCLDEGVDVPRSELAIFCASTGNPRQFIQRRGRVLRLHKDKINATIHDLVVVPEVSNNESTFEMEKSLVRKELERVVDFANLAMNKTDTYNSLKEVLDHYDLNLNDI